MKKTKKEIKSETLVNFILDKSGSMSSIQDATISGFNEYIGTLKKDGGKYAFSLTFFDTAVTKTYKNTPLKEVGELSKENYHPDGSTALYDAVCSTLKEIKDTVKKDQKVLTVIMTDGEENSSKEYDQTAIRNLIKELEATGKWSFVYLGANQDSYANAAKYGISQMNTVNFAATPQGMGNAMRAMASNTSNFATSQAGATQAFFSASDQQNLQADIDPKQNPVSQHFSNMGNKSWEARKKKLLGE